MAKIEHIALYCYDLEAMKQFFEKYLGGTSGAKYRNKVTGFESYFVTLEGETRLELMTRPTVVDAAAVPQGNFPVGFHHIAIAVGSREAVDALTAQLAADGYPTLNGPRTTGDGYYESVVEGPEGLQLEITV